MTTFPVGIYKNRSAMKKNGRTVLISKEFYPKYQEKLDFLPWIRYFNDVNHLLGSEGYTMGTMKEVAAHAGVSVATVSNVITGKRTVSPEIQKKVLQAIEELDYHVNTVARNLKTQRTMNIGVLLPDATELFYNGVMRGIMAAASENGYNITMLNSDYDFRKEKQMIDTLRSNRVDAIILDSIASCDDLEQWGETLCSIANTLPLITIMTAVSPKISSITVDCIGTSSQLTQHLLDQGYRRICYLSGPTILAHQRDRLEGYKQTLIRNGIEVDEKLIFVQDFLSSSAYQIVQNALDEGLRFDAIQVANDQAAIGVLKALKERGIQVPQEVAITGYDGLFTGTLVSPSITTIRVPAYSLGYQAVQECLRMMQEPSPVANIRHHVLDTPLIIRGSSAYCRDAAWELDR